VKGGFAAKEHRTTHRKRSVAQGKDAARGGLFVRRRRHGKRREDYDNGEWKENRRRPVGAYDPHLVYAEGLCRPRRKGRLACRTDTPLQKQTAKTSLFPPRRERNAAG